MKEFSIFPIFIQYIYAQSCEFNLQSHVLLRKSSVLYLTLQESTATQMHTLRMGENAEEPQSSWNLASRGLIIQTKTFLIRRFREL